MASSKAVIIVAAVLLLLCCVRVRCDAVAVSPSPEQAQGEVQMLRSKVASLELSSLALEDEISGRKEETMHLESVVKDRTSQIAALVSDLEVLQVTNVADDESVLTANTNNEMLEKQIVRLANDLEDQVKKGESLEARASEAEKKLLELTQKLEFVEKENIEQKQKIQELNHKLQRAKDKLSEVKREAELKAEELTKVHSMWLPHWLAGRVIRCQELTSEKWVLDVKPVLDSLLHKVSEMSTHAQRTVQPHLQTTQKKLVPVAKAHLNTLKNSTGLYVSAISARGTTAYRVCRDAVQPSMAKAQEFADHYWKESKKLSKPYIAHVIAASEPHLSRAGVALEPYTRHVMSAWRRLLVPARVYHRQVQKGVRQLLDDNGMLKPDSADTLAWLTASALYALPTFFVYRMFSAAVWKNAEATQGGGGARPLHNRRRRHMRRAHN